MGIKAGLFFLKESDIDNFVSGLILPNNLSYNLCSFKRELIHLGKSSSSKMAYVKWKITFSYVWHIKQ